MFDTHPPIRFFMGANTPNGFFGFLDDIYSVGDGWQALLIKAGPGTGKSTLMRRIGQRWEEEGESPEYLHCSSDPSSLDGVICRARRQCIVDATAPHVMEPRCWHAVEELVSPEGCVNVQKAAECRGEIVATAEKCAAEHRRCCRYLAAAASLSEDSRRLLAADIDMEKLHRSARRLAVRELGKGSGGREWRRFLSAVTPEGYLTFFETLGALCPRIIAVEDDWGAAAPLLIAALRDYAVAAGYHCFCCYNPLFPSRAEHLLVPEAGLAVTASDLHHKVDCPVYRRLHVSRFFVGDPLRRHRSRLSFHRRAIRDLTAQASAASAAAKQCHDELERLYRPAVDFGKAEELTERVWARLNGK